MILKIRAVSEDPPMLVAVMYLVLSYAWLLFSNTCVLPDWLIMHPALPNSSSSSFVEEVN